MRREKEALQVTLVDLIDLFEAEAERVCLTDGEARVLAAVALSDFLNTYGKNVVVG